MDDQIATKESRLSASELEDYFSSISDSFESTRVENQRHNFANDLLGGSVGLALFSVLPAIPKTSRMPNSLVKVSNGRPPVFSS
jgi:hypothetical protein